MKTIRFLSLACLLAGAPLLPAAVEAAVIYETDFKTQPLEKDMWGSGNDGGGGGNLSVASAESYASALMFFTTPFELSGNKFKATWQVDSLGSENQDNPQAQLRFAVAPAPVEDPEPFNLPNSVTVTVTRDNSSLKVALYEKVDGGEGFGSLLYEGETAASTLPLKISLELTSDTYSITFNKPVDTARGATAGNMTIASSEIFAGKLLTFLKLVNMGEAKANAVLGSVSFSLSENAGGH